VDIDSPTTSSEPSLTSAVTPSTAAPLSDPERWVDEYGDYLFKFALVRLRDQTKAEDMVQETFLAALRGGQGFAGRSAEKSWLVGILKNKICDYYRKSSRETFFTDLEFHSDEESDRFISDGPFRAPNPRFKLAFRAEQPHQRAA